MRPRGKTRVTLDPEGAVWNDAANFARLAVNGTSVAELASRRVARGPACPEKQNTARDRNLRAAMCNWTLVRPNQA